MSEPTNCQDPSRHSARSRAKAASGPSAAALPPSTSTDAHRKVPDEPGQRGAANAVPVVTQQKQVALGGGAGVCGSSGRQHGVERVATLLIPKLQTT